MSFPLTAELLSCKNDNQKFHPRMSVDTDNTFNASEAHNAERTGKTITGLSFDLLEERIRANLEPLNAQTLTLTQLLN